MDFGAGRYWGDDGKDAELDPWDPWPLEELWRPQDPQAQRRRNRDGGVTSIANGWVYCRVHSELLFIYFHLYSF